jgi:O-acetyl-ADP-ribose deacetylase (regulator of RNase III)
VSNFTSKLGVVTANLADMEVDALVSETDTALRLVTGASIALRVRCGPELEQRATALGPIGLGEAAVVDGGRIWARSVILCAVFGPNAPPTEATVRRAIAAAMTRIEEVQAESIAMPLLGTGPGGVGAIWCARATVDAVADRLRNGFFPQRAVLVATDMVTQRILEEAVARVSPE